MRSASIGRKSSLNPVRLSNMGEQRKTTVKPRPSAVGDTQIPRPRIRSDSSDRASYRSSVAKVSGKSSLATPTTSGVHGEIGSIKRGRSPSAERATGLCSQKTLQKDTRQINDKTYQSAMLNRIDYFFQEVQQSPILNPTTGSLKPVSLKNFVSASNFLLKLLEVKQELTSANYMEELPKIAKKLHYPGSMTKSWLKTANTMHSYPHALAWLSWLVELCEVKDLANQTFQLQTLPFVDGDDSEVINRSLFLALLELYNIWNDGKEEEEKALEKRYIKGIEDQCGFSEEDIRKEELEIEEFVKKEQLMLEEDQKLTTELDALKEKKMMLVTDVEKQKIHFAEQDKRLAELDMRMKQLDHNSQLFDKDRENYLIEIEQLNKIIQEQTMNVEERDSIISRCSQIESSMERFNDHLEELRKELWAFDMKATKSLADLENAILAFNRDIVINHRNDIGVDLDQLKLPERISQTEMVQVVTSKAKVIANEKNSLKEELSNCESFIDIQSTKLDGLHDKLRALQQENSELVLKNNETKEYLKKLKLQAQEEENQIQESIQKIQAEIKKLQESFPDDKKLSSELMEAREKLDAVERRKLHLEQSAQRFFIKFFDMLAAHKNDVNKILEKSMLDLHIL